MSKNKVSFTVQIYVSYPNEVHVQIISTSPKWQYFEKPDLTQLYRNTHEV